MDKKGWDYKRKVIRREALEEHKRLHTMFKEDRLSFELERQRMIDSLIDNASSETQKARLRDLQESWDRNMRNSGKGGNRLLRAQHFFWEQIDKIWNSPHQVFFEIEKTASGPNNK